jgi:hypothetical protein
VLLLVNSCSEKCTNNLPTPPKGYIQYPHKGGDLTLGHFTETKTIGLNKSFLQKLKDKIIGNG